jgi:D-aminopeptidase
MARKRLRQLGIRLGRYQPGRINAITDVKGVKVGHVTLNYGSGKLISGVGPVRTGVTAILPSDNLYYDRMVSGAFVLNGAGEVAGITQITEWGLLETPILLTHSLAVGLVADATTRWMVEHHPGIGDFEDVVLPVVGECDDSFLNDAAGRHVTAEHVFKAIGIATDGPVAEGSVGAGTGMITCDFKSGIGTASRRVVDEGVPYTIGILVLSNFGRISDLRIDGVPVGAILEPDYAELDKRRANYGSIIVVLATDAPLLPNQLTRLCKRAALGIGRCGSYAAHNSGEIVVGFSTANKIPRKSRRMMIRMKALLDERLSSMYEATVEATEEAIVNSLCMAEPMWGVNDHFAPALPLDRLKEILTRYRPPQSARREPTAPRS